MAIKIIYNVLKWMAVLLSFLVQFEDIICLQFSYAVNHAILIVTRYILFYGTIEILRTIVVFFYDNRRGDGEPDNFILAVEQLKQVMLVLGGIVSLFALWGLSLREMFTSISIVAAALAILLKDYISNVINGMIVTFSNHLSLGDQVRIGNHKGKIAGITLTNIQLINDDDDLIYIPNTIVYATEIVNYTKREVKKTSIDFEMDIRSVPSVEDLEKELINTIQEYHHLINSDSYNLRVYEVRRDVLLLKFQYILKEPSRSLEREIRRKTVRRLVSLINERIVAQNNGDVSAADISLPDAHTMPSARQQHFHSTEQRFF